ncbi:MAG: hypothetical protein RL527_794 [Planctomycetota bacterium]|jgi:hypothetical protein
MRCVIALAVRPSLPFRDGRMNAPAQLSSGATERSLPRGLGSREGGTNGDP